MAVGVVVVALSGGDVRREGHRLAARVGADRSGEHAARAARYQGKTDTNIYKPSQHGFYFDRLIYTPRRLLSIRETYTSTSHFRTGS